jgi:glycosyl transferase family 25
MENRIINIIDKVFCISLDTSIDRQKQFESRFPELVKSETFEWYKVKKDSENPRRGCYNSHRNILQLSKDRKYKQVLIFEDDADLHVPWNIFVNKVNDIKYEKDWKLIQLGYYPIATKRIKGNNTLVKIICSYCTHSYIINVQKLIIPEYNGIEIDALLTGCETYAKSLINNTH